MVCQRAQAAASSGPVVVLTSVDVPRAFIDTCGRRGAERRRCIISRAGDGSFVEEASAAATMSKRAQEGRSTRATRQRRSRARTHLTTSKALRGLSGEEIVHGLDDPDIAALVEQVRSSGGVPIAAYREPLAGRPILLASLPFKAIQPTPFQRDLSPTHTKRLAKKIEESGSFLDPLIVVRGDKGVFWTPNGRHRLAAARLLGLRQLMALVSPDESLAYRILALNTEKPHNLKDRSLEVIRMARELARREPRSKEAAYAEEFEAPELLTLGLVYEKEKRFAGGAYAPFLKKVEQFLDQPLAASLRRRTVYATRLIEIDRRVKGIVAGLQARGFKSPYLRTLVVARINPVRFKKAKKGETGPLMDISEALTRAAASARAFNLASVKPGELALVAAVADE